MGSLDLGGIWVAGDCHCLYGVPTGFLLFLLPGAALFALFLPCVRAVLSLPSGLGTASPGTEPLLDSSAKSSAAGVQPLEHLGSAALMGLH